MANESFAVTGLLGAYSHYYLSMNNSKVWVNGAAIALKNGCAPFTTSFDKTGPQPLALRVELYEKQCDNFWFFEKTYTVNVK